MFQCKHLGGGSSGGSGFSSISFSLGLIFSGLSINCDLDSNSSAADFLAFDELDSFLLLLLATDINEAVALGLAGLTPAAANNTSGVNVNTSLSEQGTETSIIDREAEVGHEEDGLGGLSSGILTSRALGARCTGLASLLLGGGISTFSRSSTLCSRSGITRSGSLRTLSLTLFRTH